MLFNSSLKRFTLFLLATTLLIFGLVQAKTFLYPLLFALLIGYLLYPLVAFMEKKGIPRILSILVAILLAYSLIFAVLFALSQVLSIISQNLDSLRESAKQNLRTFQERIRAFIPLSDRALENFFETQVNNMLENGIGGLGKVFSATTSTVFTFFIIPVYVFLFLYYRTKFAIFILKSVRSEKRFIAIRVLKDIANISARYIGGVTIVVLILCILNSTGLAILRVVFRNIDGMEHYGFLLGPKGTKVHSLNYHKIVRFFKGLR